MLEVGGFPAAARSGYSRTESSNSVGEATNGESAELIRLNEPALLRSTAFGGREKSIEKVRRNCSARKVLIFYVRTCLLLAQTLP